MATEIASSALGVNSPVASAIKRAGERTGVDFDFLMQMAVRESSLNPDAKAKTSSAAGLFQFIEQTWLGTVKAYGDRHGLGDFSADIERGANGKFTVANAARRDEILKLRFDANASAALAGELANENKSFLEARLGRAASSADLYTAHFLGPAGAVKLLSAGAALPAADLLPRAAAANRHVFYDGARARSVGEVVASIAKSIGGDRPSQSAINGPLQHTVAARTVAGVGAVQLFANGKPSQHIHDTAAALKRNAAYTDTRAGAHDVVSGAALIATPGRLSALALSVLQALDPTRLSAQRSDDRF